MMINRNKEIGLISFLGLLLLVITSCDPDAKYRKKEQAEIDAYISNNPNLSFQVKSSGLYYLDVVIGTGPAPVTNDSVFVLYTCKDLNGVIYGSNVELHALTGEYYGFLANKGENVAGFDEAILLMKKGGKASIIVPSSLAYGRNGNPWIPGWEPLLFDIELVQIKPVSGR